MKYQLLAEATNTKLQNDINKLLKLDWELYGNPFSVDSFFFQAVIKKEKKDKGN